MPQQEPLVSVIVPVYNAQQQIARCVESIRRQSYTNLEILLLNDGSRDVSLEVCQMYARVDPRILIVDKNNSGVSSTRNIGLRLAKGEYLQFVDSDDYLTEEATRLMVEAAQRSQADMVIAPYYRMLYQDLAQEEKPRRFFSKKAPICEVYSFLKPGVYDKKTFARHLMDQPASFYYGVLWNKLYRRQIVADHDIFCDTDLDWSEDFLFNLEYIRYAERFCSIETPVYYYMKTPGSLCATKINVKSVVETKMALFAYYKELYESMGLYEENKMQIYKYLLASAER